MALIVNVQQEGKEVRRDGRRRALPKYARNCLPRRMMVMSVKAKASPLRARFPRGGIGSYGNYPRDASYDHGSFLAEMPPASFRRNVNRYPYGLTGEAFAARMVSLPIAASQKPSPLSFSTSTEKNA